MAGGDSSSKKNVQSKLYPLFFQPASNLVNNGINAKDKEDDNNDDDDDDEDEDDLEISLSDLGKKISSLSKRKKGSGLVLGRSRNNDKIMESQRKRMTTTTTSTNKNIAKLPLQIFSGNNNSTSNINTKNKENKHNRTATTNMKNKKRRIENSKQTTQSESTTTTTTTTDVPPSTFKTDGETNEKQLSNDSNGSDGTSDCNGNRDDGKPSSLSSIQYCESDNVMSNNTSETATSSGEDKLFEELQVDDLTESPKRINSCDGRRSSKNCRRRRILSSSSMDYSPIPSSDRREQQQPRYPTSTTSPFIIGRNSKNILFQLYHRPIYGSCGYRHGRTAATVVAPSHGVGTNKSQWKSPSWLKLEPPPTTYSTNNSYNHSTTSVHHLAWDKMGILLASSSSNKTISIYDWDMIKLAHQNSLNEKQRYKVEKLNLLLKKKEKEKKLLGEEKQKKIMIMNQEQEQQQQQVQSDTVKIEDDQATPKTDLTTPINESTTLFGTSSSLSSSSTTSTTTTTTRRSQWSMPPVLSFSVPHVVTSLIWNPHNMDQLAVGLQLSGTVRLYHVDLVADWISIRNENRHRSHNSWTTSRSEEERRSNVPPPSTYTVLSDPRTTRGGTVSSILFVDATTVLVCLGKLGIYCWDFTKEIANLRWRYQPHHCTVKSMALFGPEWVIVGTDIGTFLLINWTKSVERKQRAALSTRSEVPQPQFIHEYIPVFDKEDVKNKMVPERKLAISKLHVENLTSTWNQRSTIDNDNDVGSSTNINSRSAGRHQQNRRRQVWRGRCRVTWITPCGWVLSMQIDLPPQSTSSSSSNRKTNISCQVCHSPCKVVVQNADGTIIDPTANQRPDSNSSSMNQSNNYLWSLPVKPVAANYSCDDSGSACKNGSNSVLCWTSVPPVTKILPHHNKYVLTSQPRIVRKQESLLLWKDWRNDYKSICVEQDDSQTQNAAQLHKIHLPKSWNIPSVIAVHPSREWIVVGGIEHQWMGVLSCRE